MAGNPIMGKDHQKLHSVDPEGLGFLDNPKQATTDEPGDDKTNAVDDTAEATDESGNFSDIDDVEVDGYIHNEEEKRYKKIIWEEMNREYLEEQAAKEAALAAAEALRASNGNCSEAARKLVEATTAAVEKRKKEKREKKAAEAKNTRPPETGKEAAFQMLNRKRMSSKINMDALDKLFDASMASGSPKKRKTESNTESDDENCKASGSPKKRKTESNTESDDENYNASNKRHETDDTYGDVEGGQEDDEYGMYERGADEEYGMEEEGYGYDGDDGGGVGYDYDAF